MTAPNPIVVREYLARVRTALADLPSGELDEVLDDVRPHLAEIAVELGDGANLAAMIERLGTPESYAAELRAAGDYPPPSPVQEAAASGKASVFGLRIAVWSVPLCALLAFTVAIAVVGERSDGPLWVLLLFSVPVLGWAVWYVTRRGVDTAAELSEVRSLNRLVTAEEGSSARVTSYLRSLLPAWWLIAGLIIAMVAVVMLRWFYLEIPALLVLAGMVAVLVWAGPRARHDRRWLWAVVPLSAFALGSGIGLVDGAIGRYSSQYYAYAGHEGYAPDPSTHEGLRYSGRPVHNIYAFDTKGRPLSEVYLFDQAGRPIELPRQECDPRGNQNYREGDSDNVFPHPTIEINGTAVEIGDPYMGYDEYAPDGAGPSPERVCEESDEVPFTAAIVKREESGESSEDGAGKDSEKESGEKPGKKSGTGSADDSDETPSATPSPTTTQRSGGR